EQWLIIKPPSSDLGLSIGAASFLSYPFLFAIFNHVTVCINFNQQGIPILPPQCILNYWFCNFIPCVHRDPLRELRLL
ncbi:unnamed protein product, partial [Brassica rapa subsp. trilocularis]